MNQRILNLWQEWNILFIFVVLKLLIHFIFNANYEFHRDEYLYLDEARHLNWGYMEVPPMIAVIGKIGIWLGGSVFAVRLLPTLAGTAILILVGLMVKELGGKKWAMGLACLAYLLSPAFLRGSMFLMPVVFNQLMW